MDLQLDKIKSYTNIPASQWLIRVRADNLSFAFAYIQPLVLNLNAAALGSQHQCSRSHPEKKNDRFSYKPEYGARARAAREWVRFEVVSD